MAAHPGEAQETWTSLLAEMCAACHGPAGVSPGSIPAIAELEADAMQAFLTGFRDGDIEATVMGRIAGGLNDREIAELARHLAGIMASEDAPDIENEN